MDRDIIIIGGGLLGLATAYHLSNGTRRRILVLEKEDSIAQHQSGHNSGVIHSGVYYKPGSLKGTLCFKGYKMLLDFCVQHDVPFNICGKVIVATNEREMGGLYKILANGNENGLEGLKLVGRDELHDYEPHVAGLGGIFVPQTGIINFRQVAGKYAEVYLQQGGEIAFREEVISIAANHATSTVITKKGTYTAKLIINCAGLHSDKLAALTHPRLNLRIIPFRGEYFKLKPEKEYLVRNLIYPVPDPSFPFLGVHFTRQIAGGVEAGPNAVLAMKREGYRKGSFNYREFMDTLSWPGFRKVAMRHFGTGLGEMYRSFSKSAFTRALQRLVPEIQSSDLCEGGAGVRAQACERSGKLIDDFVILEHPGIVNVCNAPSPAATSSLAIGETIAGMAEKQLR